jgi:hypothetical protein
MNSWQEFYGAATPWEPSLLGFAFWAIGVWLMFVIGKWLIKREEKPLTEKQRKLLGKK